MAVRAIADLEDHLHPGRTFRTSRSAPLRVSGLETPGEGVADAALRAVLSIEEHEIQEQLILDAKRSQPLDPHQFPNPTNTAPRSAIHHLGGPDGERIDGAPVHMSRSHTSHEEML